jgi:hypothetical protein
MYVMTGTGNANTLPVRAHGPPIPVGRLYSMSFVRSSPASVNILPFTIASESAHIPPIALSRAAKAFLRSRR